MFKSKKLIISLLIITGVISYFTIFTKESINLDSKKEEVQLTVATGAVGKELELAQKAAESYMKDNPNIKVNIIDAPDIADNRRGLYEQFLKNESPEIDIYQIDIIWPGDLAEHFIDLNDYLTEEVTEKYFSAIIENNTVDDRLVALPWFSDAGLLYYRKDLLEKYGFNPPKTWADLERTARYIKRQKEDLNQSDFAGFIWQGSLYEGLSCTALEWLVSHGSGRIIEDDGQISINNQHSIRALERAKNWVGDISPNDVLRMNEESARKEFTAGNALFMRNWPYVYGLLMDDQKMKDKFGITALPKAYQQSHAGTLGGWQLSVSRYSEYQAEAVDLILFLSSYEEQKRRAIDGFLNPTLKDLYQDPEVLAAVPYLKELEDVFTNAVARPSTVSAPNYNYLSREFYTGVYNVLTGVKDATTVVRDLEKRYLEQDLGYKKSAYYYYTIRAGDTLNKIARENDTTIEELIELNGITDGDIIYRGQRIKINR